MRARFLRRRRNDTLVHVVDNLHDHEYGVFIDVLTATAYIRTTNKTIRAKALCGVTAKLHGDARSKLTKDATTCLLCLHKEIHEEQEHQGDS